MPTATARLVRATASASSGGIDERGESLTPWPPDWLLWILIVLVGWREGKRWCTKSDHEKEDIAELVRRDREG